MSKRNTVQINMEVFDNWLKESNYKSPKEFCKKELGLSDGWYYGIRKNNGKGVKTLLAMLIADKMGIHIDKLLYLEDTEKATFIAKEEPKPAKASGSAQLAESTKTIAKDVAATSELFCDICSELLKIINQLESQEA